MANIKDEISQEEYERIKPFFVSFFSLRKAVGWLGILLAPILVVGTFILSECSSIQYSISHYYFTIMGDVFVGIICAISFFLIAYPGYEKIDNRLTNIAGFLAVGIAFLPTSPILNQHCTIVNFPANELREKIHLIFGGLFFSLLAYIAAFRFTKTDLPKEQMSAEKKMRNGIYIICGSIMSLAVILLIFVSFNKQLEDEARNYHFIFWLESIALLAFGLSWLVKGELFLKDNPLKDTR